MDDKNNHKFVEELLEASLKRYRSEEPPAGLENRILANARASDRAAQRRRWVWAWALAASTAVLIIAVVVLHFTSRPAPRTATVTRAPQTVAPKAETPKVVAVAPSVARVPGRPVRTLRRPSPEFRRPEQFPTPSPLTEQERLLLQYVSATPPSVLVAQANQSREDQDLSIPELTIAALEPIKPVSESDKGPKN